MDEFANKDLPRMVDDQTELVKLDDLEGVLVYYFRLPNIAPGQLTAAYLIEKLLPVVVNQSCTTSDTRENFLDNGVTL